MRRLGLAVLSIAAPALGSCGGDTPAPPEVSSVTAVPADTLVLGERVRLSADVAGTGVRTLTLQADPYPFGSWHTVATRPFAGDTVFRETPAVNTRYRVVAAAEKTGVGPARTIYVNPRTQIRATLLGPRSARFVAQAKLAPSAETRLGVVYFYLRRAGKPYFELLGSALRTPAPGHRLVAILEKRLEPHRSDKFFICVRTRFSPAMGRQNVQLPDCGGARIPYPPPQVPGA